VVGDLDSQNALRELVEGCDAIVHLAGAIRGRRRSDFAAVNRDGTARLAESARRHAPGAHFIYVSSLAAREPGLSWYAETKHLGEAAVRDHLARSTIIRPPPVYGPDDPALAPLWKGLARGWLPVLGSRRNRFSLVHVSDLVEALCRLVEFPRGTGRTLTIHDGRPAGYDWDGVAALGAEMRGAPVRVVELPVSLASAVASANLRLSAVAGQAPILIPGKVRELAHPDWFCDNETLTEVLGWRPAIELRRALPGLPGWERHR